jgi:opacity protein-like surface antigen
MRRSLAAVIVAATTMTGVASAQTAADRGYVEGVAQSAFGNVTSQSFGGEVGFNLTPTIQVFGEGGHVGDAATAAIGTAAQLIAGYLSTAQPQPVDYSVKQPVTFGAAGIRYLFPTTSPAVTPYVLAGGGAAAVKSDVKFTIAGSEVTNNLGDYGVVLGSDLSGSVTKAMLVVGGGVQWAAWRQMIVDLQYRYNRVFTDPGMNINRAGVGIGFRF